MLRQGSGPPLFLFHGVTGSEGLWQRVIPIVAEHHDAIAPTALGHFGGAAATRRPARIADVVDDAERLLDTLKFEKAHLAGNSMGGWMALELARRGRALSVCALSPAGCWTAGSEDNTRSRDRIRRAVRDTRMGRWLLPVLARSGRFRRWALQVTAAHGDRIDAREMVALADALLGCTIIDDVLATPESVAPLDPPPCPVTLAWSAKDRILPLDINGKRARELVPGARFLVLDDVGHMPMVDDPALVARTILETTGAAQRG
jgi:pimeloyl-ACP methyl ester carboxylesterase